ncbi:peptidase S10 [Kordiimonas sediminis]|uniref:Peptidase S10 n=1 Tax=Kordiimonas sediminis TaxID=1735581 RepID=A0A919AT96_9PROT|nr:peptidase S10 [Kordiimonas sediminis]GHF25080.1 peptidase S10 [Kordiimonas sediminis]
MKFFSSLAAASIAVLIAVAPLSAKDGQAQASGPVPDAKVFETEHTGTYGGVKVRYKAIAGETYLKDEKDQPVASIFSTSYIRTDIKDNNKRPVFFIFNGGPGSASLWLHMGVYGPKRIAVPSDARDDGAAPFDLVENPLSILDVADMVFIDPVGTGYSRVVGKGDGKDYWGVDKDAKSIAEFIRVWLVKNKRWNSPKYLSGESYGTTRSAALLHELSGGWTDIAINGVVFISSILDFQTVATDPGNDTHYLSYLPTMAATGWYHGKVEKAGRTLEQFLDEVRDFTLGEYASALLQGNRLSADDFDAVASKVAAYTGLKKQYVVNSNLRITNMRFMKELRRDEGLSVGRLDSRYVGKEYDGAAEYMEADPSAYGIDASYTAAMMHHYQTNLGVDLERRYDVISSVGRHWTSTPRRFNSFMGGYENVAPYVGTAQRQNSDLKLMVANGYYDFATPFFASENSFNHNGIDTSRVTFTYYESGHMMYVHEPSLEKLVKDIRDFIAE